MKLSLFSDLNDPFELLPYSLNQGDMRRVGNALRSHFTKSKGLICFSDNWRSPVMWAHYAEKHYGICLGFDVPDEVVGEVQYNADRLQFVLDQNKHLLGIGEEFIQALLYTKASGWSYERERRVLADLNERDENGFYYVDFGPQLVLREVVIGARNPTPIGQVAKQLKGLSHSVQVLKARAAFQEFAMVRNQAVKAINVPPAKQK